MIGFVCVCVLVVFCCWASSFTSLSGTLMSSPAASSIKRWLSASAFALLSWAWSSYYSFLCFLSSRTANSLSLEFWVAWGFGTFDPEAVGLAPLEVGARPKDIFTDFCVNQKDRRCKCFKMMLFTISESDWFTTWVLLKNMGNPSRWAPKWCEAGCWVAENHQNPHTDKSQLLHTVARRA